MFVDIKIDTNSTSFADGYVDGYDGFPSAISEPSGSVAEDEYNAGYKDGVFDRKNGR